MFRNLKFVCEIASFRKYATIAKEVINTKFSKDDSPPIEVAYVPHSRYGGRSTVTLLTGSAVGNQGSEYIKSIFHKVNAPIDLELLNTSNEEVVPNEFLLSVMRNGTALYIDTIHKTEIKQKSLLMNTHLDLFACIVNCFSIPGYSRRFSKTDIVIIMQNNRGDFSKLEYEPVNGVVETLKICDRQCVERYIEFAFKYASDHGRKKITFGHKSTELPISDGMHLKVARRFHEEKHPHIEIEDMLINKIARHLVMDPSRFDVICLDDKYGTFVTSVVSGICGGANLFSASEVGDHHAIFKPLQTKLSITDSGALCPYGTITTAVNLLNHLGYKECASILWRGLMKIMTVDNIKTPEFGGKFKEEEVINKLLDVLSGTFCQHNQQKTL